MKTIKNIAGFKNGVLTVIKPVGRSRSGNATWLCECVCGVKIIYSQDHICRKTNSVKSCGCRRFKSANKHHQWNGVGEMSGQWWNQHVKARKGVEVLITKEYAWNLFQTQNRKCALTGVDLILNNNQRINTASIDRIDNCYGYVENNIQWVHKHINRMKGSYSNNYFVEMCHNVSFFNVKYE